MTFNANGESTSALDDFDRFGDTGLIASTTPGSNKFDWGLAGVSVVKSADVVIRKVRPRKYVTLVHNAADKRLFKYLQSKLHVGGSILSPGKKVAVSTFLFQGSHEKAITKYLAEAGLLSD